MGRGVFFAELRKMAYECFEKPGVMVMPSSDTVPPLRHLLDSIINTAVKK